MAHPGGGAGGLALPPPGRQPFVRREEPPALPRRPGDSAAFSGPLPALHRAARTESRSKACEILRAADCERVRNAGPAAPRPVVPPGTSLPPACPPLRGRRGPDQRPGAALPVLLRCDPDRAPGCRTRSEERRVG